MKKMMVLTIAVFLFCIPIAHAEQIVVKGQSYMGIGKTPSIFLVTENASETDKTIVIDCETKYYRFKGKFNNFFTTWSDVSFTSKPLIDFSGHERRISEYHPETRKLTVKYYTANKLIDTKVYENADRLVDSDVIHIFLQGYLQTHAPPCRFEANVLQKIKSMIIKSQFSIQKVAKFDAIPAAKDVPAFFKPLKQSTRSYIWCEMRFSVPSRFCVVHPPH
jgi:hypothetical protein